MALATQPEQPREEGLGDVDRVPLPQEGFHSLLSEGAIACHRYANVWGQLRGAIARIRGAERRGAAMVALRGVAFGIAVANLAAQVDRVQPRASFLSRHLC